MKNKVRFTIIDATAILIIIIVGVFVWQRVYNDSPKKPTQISTEDLEVTSDAKKDIFLFEIEYIFDEVPDYIAIQVKEGDKITDEVMRHSLGKVTKTELGESLVYVQDMYGELHKTTKEGYKSLKIISHVKGGEYKHGAEISQATYVAGHSLTIYAGKAKLYGRISKITKIRQEK